MLKAILQWVGAAFISLFALFAFSEGGILGGILFLLLAFIISPLKKYITPYLPSVLCKRGIAIAAGVVMFFAACMVTPTESTDATAEDVMTAVESTEILERTILEQGAESIAATSTPMILPTITPTATVTPTAIPTQTPTPTIKPTVAPTPTPTATPTIAPTIAPTVAPTVEPTPIPIAEANTADNTTATRSVAEPAAITATIANSGGNTVSLPAGTLVWKSATGEKFHNKNNCGRMNPAKATQITVEKAVSIGLEACEKCY